MANIKTVNPYGGFDRALQKNFTTVRAKREYMKAHGIHETGSSESDKKRTSRNAEIVNEERNRKGLKSKTVHELVGNSRKIPGKTLYFFT